MEFLPCKLCRKTFVLSTMGTGALKFKAHKPSKKNSNAAGQSSRGSASKGRMQLTSYLGGKKLERYGKAMEFFFWGSVQTLLRVHINVSNGEC